MGSNAKSYDILIAGAGIFGVTAAIELAKRDHRVALINPDQAPHHLAASTDISKAVRMEYGSDLEYFQMAEISIRRWHQWNDLFNTELYHQVGFLMLCKEPITSERQSFERASHHSLLTSGYTPEIIERDLLEKQFPAVNPQIYAQACYNPVGGYAESSRTIEHLISYATSLGVDVHLGQTAEQLIVQNQQLTGIKTREGSLFHCGHAHIAAGAHTPWLVPDLSTYFKATGHPVFWLRPKDPELFKPPNFVVFTADIANSGWYGFPFNENHGVVKVARHSNGQVLHPEKDDRRVTDQETFALRSFLKDSLPELAEAPLVYTRKCLYTDTLDGHYWIDKHPEIRGLSVGTGGCGHGLKMGPILGELQADMIEEKSNQFSKRFRWRHLTKETAEKEQARHMED